MAFLFTHGVNATFMSRFNCNQRLSVFGRPIRTNNDLEDMAPAFQRHDIQRTKLLPTSDQTPWREHECTPKVRFVANGINGKHTNNSKLVSLMHGKNCNLERFLLNISWSCVQSWMAPLSLSDLLMMINLYIYVHVFQIKKIEILFLFMSLDTQLIHI